MKIGKFYLFRSKKIGKTAFADPFSLMACRNKCGHIVLLSNNDNGFWFDERELEYCEYQKEEK